MAKFIVDQASVPKEKYQVYLDTSKDTVIAVDREFGEKKVQDINRKYRQQSAIPEDEVVIGVILRFNELSGKHEMHSGMEHEYQIKNLLFPNLYIYWE